MTALVVVAGILAWVVAVVGSLLFFAGAQDLVRTPEQRKALIRRDVARMQAVIDRIRATCTDLGRSGFRPDQHADLPPGEAQSPPPAGRIRVDLPRTPFFISDYPPSRWFN